MKSSSGDFIPGLKKFYNPCDWGFEMNQDSIDATPWNLVESEFLGTSWTGVARRTLSRNQPVGTKKRTWKGQRDLYRSYRDLLEEWKQSWLRSYGTTTTYLIDDVFLHPNSGPCHFQHHGDFGWFGWLEGSDIAQGCLSTTRIPWCEYMWLLLTRTLVTCDSLSGPDSVDRWVG